MRAARRSAPSVVTIIELDSADAAAALLWHLRGQEDVAVDIAAPNRLRASVIGSYGVAAMQLELALRVRAWEEAERARGRSVGVVITQQG